MQITTKHHRYSRLLSPGIIRVCCLLLLLLSAGHLSATERVKVGVLKFGTANWELDTVRQHQLDRKHGIELDVLPLAGKQATMVALQGNEVNVALTDWFWVSRQRSQGRMYRFFPYSTAGGSLVVKDETAIHALADLKGKKVGIAGGPLDKNWLLFRAWTLRYEGWDLAEHVTPVFAAPPLLNQQLKQGRVDAIINFWPYVARLQAQGMRVVVGAPDIAQQLGIENKIALVGYVFDEQWAKENDAALKGFHAAVREARQIMARSDAEWVRLRPLMKAPDDATFESLKNGFRSGIPESGTAATLTADADRLFAILAELGGRNLVGDSDNLAAGTFWNPEQD